MFGEPKDIPGECNAHLYIADNFGDGVATIRCQLAKNHDGRHEEKFMRDGTEVIITWVLDEKEVTEDTDI